MHRFLGSKGGAPKAAAPTLTEVSTQQATRIEELQGRIRKLDAELVKYREQMKKSRPGTASYNSVKRRAMQLMKQRKMYDTQLGQMMDMEFNMSNITMAQEQMEMTKASVDAMRVTAKTMKQAQKAGKMDIASIENLQDELSDMMEDAAEIQEIMGQSYGVPDDFDEDDMMAELDMIEDEIIQEDLMGSAPDVPSYVNSGAPEPEADADDLAALESQMTV